MCGFLGFCNFLGNYKEETGRWFSILQEMYHSKDPSPLCADSVYITSHAAFAHTSPPDCDTETLSLPLTRQNGELSASIIFHGEIYNDAELKQYLKNEGVSLTSHTAREIILMGYLHEGISFIKKVNGVFSFCIFDSTRQMLFLVRDRLGVKPLFYTFNENTLIFSTKLANLFSYPGIEPILEKEGLLEIFGLGPAKTPGKAIFKNIYELSPGTILIYQRNSCNQFLYWHLFSHPHEDSLEKTVEKTRFLITDAIHLQMKSKDRLCSFLSGGVDSSLVTSVSSNTFIKEGKQLDTYSFDFTDNQKNFKSNAFQPSLDRPYVDLMVTYANTRHHYLECDHQTLYDYLFKAVDARDLPCMADVESSLLYFCEKVVPEKTIALTGECADEIFGGYPWFHKEEMLSATTFPWSMDFGPRTMLLKEEVNNLLPLQAYAEEAYINTLAQTPTMAEDSPVQKRKREISYLTIRWFMQTLLDRMDRVGSYTGLTARVPFADYRLVEYLWNVPWEMKNCGGHVKGLLRKASEGLLPTEVLYRKKSPYPKTYDPQYEALLKAKLWEVLDDCSSPIKEFIDSKKVADYFDKPSNYTRPFYGQLMAGPQLIAYLLQVNYWLKEYKIRCILDQ